MSKSKHVYTDADGKPLRVGSKVTFKRLHQTDDATTMVTSQGKVVRLRGGDITVKSTIGLEYRCAARQVRLATKR